jgi:SAM-dependent methyltransferase
MSEGIESRVNAHYGRRDLGEDLLDWLRTQGKELDALTLEDLLPLDQLHYGGLAATQKLAEMAGVSGDSHVADLGGGLGGPARFLAGTYGCAVDVVDLTDEFCRVGEMLSGLVRLADKVRFHHASATATGLADAAYDLVWMQNAAMNIEDRSALYREVRRLLRPSGCYVFQEVMAGDGGPAYYPLNWATSEGESFLQKPESILRMLLDAGFRVLAWEDETAVFRESQPQEAARRAQTSAMPHYISHDRARDIARNAARSNAEDRLRLGRGLFQKI